MADKYIVSKYEKLTDEQINREIGARLGFWVYHYDKDVASKCYYTLMTSEGDPVTHDLVWGLKGRGEHKTANEAWGDVPNFAGDALVGLTLLGRDHNDMPYATEWTASCTKEGWQFSFEDGPVVRSTEYARGNAIAWLEWRDQVAAATPTINA